MLIKLKAGKLEFEPKADTETLIGQAQIMNMYLNTLEVRALEEDYISSNNKMKADTFLETYNNFLDDSSKIKCLTDREGNIINISRPGFDTPVLHIILKDNGLKEVIYFDLSSMHKDAVDSLASYLMHNTKKDINIKIDFTGNTEKQKEILTFDDYE